MRTSNLTMKENYSRQPINKHAWPCEVQQIMDTKYRYSNPLTLQLARPRPYGKFEGLEELQLQLMITTS
jgi:hypothetical protein